MSTDVIIIGLLILVWFMLVIDTAYERSLRRDLRNQHRASTQVATVKGLIRAWVAFEDDPGATGVPRDFRPPQGTTGPQGVYSTGPTGARILSDPRRDIYLAIEEAFRAYDRIVAR